MKKLIWALLASIAIIPLSAQDTQDTNGMSNDEKQDCCCWEPGYEVPCECMTPGYNYPAQIDTQGWDVYISASFLYWKARQDGMSLALVNNAANSTTTVASQNYKYKPGFKVEAGFRSSYWDHWGGLVEYSRLHGIYKNNNINVSGQTIHGYDATTMSSKWKNDLDVIDFGLFRSYYVGRKLTFMTYFGGRGGWLDQNLNFDVNLVNPAPGITNPIEYRSKSDSWFIGPRMALRTNWLLGCGFSIVGNTSASICYQKYKVRINEQSDTTPNTNTYYVQNVSQLRPYYDLQAGLRWGWYTCDQKFHFDLQATYDLMVYFSQNMIRSLIDIAENGNDEPPGDLYFHGLTLKGMFSF